MFQFSSNVNFRSRASRNESLSSCLSSVVLDGSDEQHMQTSTKEDRFVYHFVHKDNILPDERIHNQDSKIWSDSSVNDLQCSLRNGDRVVMNPCNQHIVDYRVLICCILKVTYENNVVLSFIPHFLKALPF